MEDTRRQMLTVLSLSALVLAVAGAAYIALDEPGVEEENEDAAETPETEQPDDDPREPMEEEPQPPIPGETGPEQEDQKGHHEPEHAGGYLDPESGGADEDDEAVARTGEPTQTADSPWFQETSETEGFSYQGDVWSHEGSANGVYVSDHDGDGRPDVLAVNGSRPELFENTGDGFERSEALPTLSSKARNATAALFFDHDNSGYDDLYLLSDDGSVFLENTGGSYREKDVGLQQRYGSVRGAAAADYTGNGCLDVFVVQANDWMETRPAGFNDRDVAMEEDNGNPNRLFAGDCEEFTDTTEEAGIRGESWSLATSFVDFTNDGYPDIHVANDFNNDILYLNNGDGSFERRVMLEYTNRNGMSSEVADVTGNGYLDIFVTNIYGDAFVPPHRFGGRTEGNNLLVNRGDGEFRDAADEYGVEAGGWGWAALLEDFDNSGHLDLYHSVLVREDGEGPVFFRNEPQEEGFLRLEHSSVGLERESSLGVASLDYDVDGSVDIAASSVGRSYSLYSNLNTGSYLKVDVKGEGGHTTLGTRVEVSYGDRTQTAVKSSRSDYMSQSSRTLHFGLGSADSVDTLHVERPDGAVQEFHEVDANQSITVHPDGVTRLR